MLVHLSKDAHGKYAYNPIAVNFLVEIVKTVFALTTLFLYVGGGAGVGGWVVWDAGVRIIVDHSLRLRFHTQKIS